MIAELRARVAQLSDQLEVKDEQLRAAATALAEKDSQLAIVHKQLREGGKRARVVNFNGPVSVQLIAFGENMSSCHISDERTQRVLAEPEVSVPTWLTLALQEQRNRNVRVPNIRAPIVQTYDGHGWHPREKDRVLGELVENVAMHLESHAGDDVIGRRFSTWYDELVGATESNAPLFRQQKHLVLQTIADIERADKL